jgi:hypothetical protein
MILDRCSCKYIQCGMNFMVSDAREVNSLEIFNIARDSSCRLSDCLNE